MKRPLKLVVIGGVAAGTKAASKARREDHEMEITIITDDDHISYAGCGLAYYIGGVVNNRDSLFIRPPQAFREKYNIDVLPRHRAERISIYDNEVRVLRLDDGKKMSFPYDRLLIATGASPIIPTIDKIDAEGVFPLRTVVDADSIKAWISANQVKNACIIGGGYIGVEMAENFKRLGIQSTIFEMTPQVMPGQFDTDMAESALKIIREQGVTVHTDTAVDGIITDSGNRIIAVVAGGKEYPCDIAILAAGVKPNSDIAREARITVGPTGAIKTDKHMETSMKNIYAAGDCAETTNVVSGKPSWVPLGSTANRQGRVAGANIAGGRLEFPGISATSMVKVFDAGFARAGLSDSEAKREGFNPVSVVIETPTRPGYYPGGVTITCKMTADAGSGKVLGVQAHAPETADKVIDAAAAGMMNGYTVDDFINLDTSYTPPYSLPLGALNIAATVLEGKM